MRMFRGILVIVVLACPCLARVITVPADYSNIQTAINSALNGDTVLIQPGIYTGTGNRDISFLGKRIVVTGTDPNNQSIVEATVVDCGGIAAGSHQGFIFNSGESAASVLRGITVANAYVNNKNGGGLFCSATSPTFDKCILRNNKADMSNSNYGYGGGFYLVSSSPTFTDCVFRGNTAFYRGGGGSSQGANPSFIRCVFQDNDAIEGGAFSAYIGKLTFNNCTFVGNGGNGHAGMSALDLQAVDSASVVRYCLFTGNNGYGVVCNDRSSLTYDSCIFVGNITGYEYGAVYNWGNGGIMCYPVFLNCVMANNSGTTVTGGMRNETSSPTLNNCILWGNSPNNMVQVGSGSPRITYTCMGNGWPGPIPAGCFNADPLFVNMAGGNVHLRSNSPCIDAGDPNFRYTGQKDFDGLPRRINQRIDIGAYEFQLPPRIIYVDDDANGANNGTNWASAFRYLQDAFSNDLAPGDKIRVAQGVYRPDRGANMMLGYKQSAFRLVLGVTMEGGYAGFGAADPNKRDVELYKTVLSGDLSGNDANGIGVTQLLTAPSRSENCNHVVAGVDVDANTVLDGFIIEKGNANDESWDGGGIYNSGGSPTIKNCTFRLNTSKGLGGAIFNTNSSNPKLINCRIAGNYALNNGGGLYSNAGSSPTLINCDICGNNATTCGGIGGNQSSLNMKNCVLYGNSDPSGSAEPSQLLITNGTTTVNYSCIQNWTGVLGGIGNFFADPLFVDANDNTDATHYDFHLLPDSLCIDAGEPNSSWEAEPWPNGARINIGSYGNTPQATQSRNGMQFAGFNIIDKTRIGRTTYRYTLSLSLTNATAGNMTNVYVKLIEACEQVTKIIDGNIFFPLISAGSTVNSNDFGDYFVIEVDRSKLIIPGRLTWQVDYTKTGAMAMQMMSAGFLMEENSTPGDITGDSIVGYADLQVLAGQWLKPPGNPSADIAPTPAGDGIVDWIDFALLAKNWAP